MNSPASDIASLIASEGLGTFNGSSGWSIHVSKEPTAPDTCITVYDTGEYPSSPQIDQDDPTVQVRIRGAASGYLAAYLKAQDVKRTVHIFRGAIGSATTYAGVFHVNGPTHIGEDSLSRPLFTINFRALRSPTNGAYPRQRGA